MDAAWLEGRCKRKYSPLHTFQKRLRHLRAIHFRNLNFPPEASQLRLELHDFKGGLVFSGESVEAVRNPHWTVHVKGSPNNKGIIVRVLGDDELFLEWIVHLSGLVFVSRNQPMSFINLEEDSMFLSLPEGFYCDKTCFRRDGDPNGVTFNVNALCDNRPAIEADSRKLRKSYGLHSLNRLYTLERAIRQTSESAQRSQAILQSRLDVVLESRQHQLNSEIEATRLRGKVLVEILRRLEYQTNRVESQLQILRETVREREEGANERLMAADEMAKDLGQKRVALSLLRDDPTSTTLFKRQIELICGLDEYIYPIVQLPNEEHFSICSVHVPRIDEMFQAKKASDDQMLSTGIGYVYHMVVMISTLSDVPLLYPMKYVKNQPVIIDVNLESYQRKEFQLWVRGKDRVYFNHGISLLARNIAHLRLRFGLSSMRGKMMAGLHNLMRFFYAKRLAIRTSPACKIYASEPAESESSMSNTPDRSSPRTTPLSMPRLHGRVSSVPNLSVSRCSTGSYELEQGASSDHVS